MAVDIEKILRPVDNPIPPFPPKYMMLAGGEEMIIRQVGREDIPDILCHVEPLLHVERDYYDMVAARLISELLAYYRYRVQDEYVLVAQINGELVAVVNGRLLNKDIGMSCTRWLCGAACAWALTPSPTRWIIAFDIIGQKEVLIVAESPIGFRRWMIEYGLEKRFNMPHELGGVPSWALTKELFNRARETLVVGRRPVPKHLLDKAKLRFCPRLTRPRRPPISWLPPGRFTTRPAPRSWPNAGSRKGDFRLCARSMRLVSASRVSRGWNTR